MLCVFYSGAIGETAIDIVYHPFVDKLCYSKHLVSFDGLATLGLQIAHLHKIYFIEPFTRAIATSRIRIRVNVTPPMNLVYSLCCQVFAILNF